MLQLRVAEAIRTALTVLALSQKCARFQGLQNDLEIPPGDNILSYPAFGVPA